MTFEEFFKKKKIALTLLQSNEPALFAEFKNHYEQMGEKSFDHTKKYWFNQLRRRFPAPVEAKVEKVHIENQIAEQTITESLNEQALATPSTGFKPRFKAAMATKPTEETLANKPEVIEEKPTETPAPAVGFKPRFNAAKLKPVEDAPEPDVNEENPTHEPQPFVGFKPRFNAAMVKKGITETPTDKPEIKEDKPAEEMSKPLGGFKPRFNAAIVKKTVEDIPVAEPEAKQENTVEDTPTEEAPKPVVGFKPRFNAAKTKPKEPGEE